MARALGRLEIPDRGISGTVSQLRHHLNIAEADPYSFKNDYRIIAPDLRGFGASTHPGDVRSSGTMPDLVGDLLCILEHAGAPGAIVVGYAKARGNIIRRHLAKSSVWKT